MDPDDEFLIYGNEVNRTDGFISDQSISNRRECLGRCAYSLEVTDSFGISRGKDAIDDHVACAVRCAIESILLSR